MAKIGWNTRFVSIRTATDAVIVGDFRLIKMGGFVGGMLFFYDPTNGYIAAASSVSYATAA